MGTSNTSGISNFLALDVGTKRIGTARANSIARLPQPLGAVPVDGKEVEAIRRLSEEHQIDTLVIGLPRSLEGKETDQTRFTREFARKLEKLEIPIKWQDEAGTSLKARQELRESSKKDYDKGQVDSLAAVYILEDYLAGGAV